MILIAMLMSWFGAGRPRIPAQPGLALRKVPYRVRRAHVGRHRGSDFPFIAGDVVRVRGVLAW